MSKTKPLQKKKVTFMCKYCPFFSTKKCSITVHNKIHNRVYRIQKRVRNKLCVICHEKLQRNSVLFHDRIHHDYTKLIGGVCPKQFMQILMKAKTCVGDFDQFDYGIYDIQLVQKHFQGVQIDDSYCINWKRLKSSFTQARLFKKGDQFYQGNIGDCSFIGYCKLIQPQMVNILKHFVYWNVQIGFYVVRFNGRDGISNVFVSDYVPFLNVQGLQHLITAAHGLKKSVWAPILQKAYAKFSNGYPNLQQQPILQVAGDFDIYPIIHVDNFRDVQCRISLGQTKENKKSRKLQGRHCYLLENMQKGIKVTNTWARKPIIQEEQFIKDNFDYFFYYRLPMNLIRKDIQFKYRMKTAAYIQFYEKSQFIILVKSHNSDRVAVRVELISENSYKSKIVKTDYQQSMRPFGQLVNVGRYLVILSSYIGKPSVYFYSTIYLKYFMTNIKKVNQKKDGKPIL